MSYNSSTAESKNDFYLPILEMLLRLVGNDVTVALNVVHAITPQQKPASNDCGIFLLKCAESILAGDMEKMEELRSRDSSIFRILFANIIATATPNDNKKFIPETEF